MSLTEYSQNTSAIDRMNVGRDKDARYSRSAEDEAEMVEQILASDETNKVLAETFNLSVSKVWSIRNPEKAAENKLKYKNRYKGRYYNKENERKKKLAHRAKKKKLREQNKKVEGKKPNTKKAKNP